jgi:hypothetical protein
MIKLLLTGVWQDWSFRLNLKMVLHNRRNEKEVY